MPRSIFLGRPVPAPGEPLWTDDDRAWALALLAYEAELCPGCHTPLAEATDPENEFAWKAEPLRCHSCATRERAARSWPDNEQAPGSLLWTLRRRG